MIVNSPEWISTGLLIENLYVGRFQYHQGKLSSVTGNHALVWNEREFTGSVRFDNGDWESDDLIGLLIWRPVNS
jgi:hypothetical protein